MSPRLGYTQAHVNEMQALYREWLDLSPQLDAAQKYWQKTVGVMQALAESYFDGDYGRYLDAMEEGLNQCLDLPAQYNIGSDAAVWNYESQTW